MGQSVISRMRKRRGEVKDNMTVKGPLVRDFEMFLRYFGDMSGVRRFYPLYLIG